MIEKNFCRLPCSFQRGINLTGDVSPFITVVISWILVRLLSLLIEFNRIKHLCAWLATSVGVLEITKFREMLL